MIMYSLHPSQGFGPTLVDAAEAVNNINAMVADGVNVRSRTFNAADGHPVSVFWTVDKHGQVATVWEYSYTFFTFNAPLSPQQTHDSALIMAEQDRLTGAYTQYDRDAEYAVGE